MRRAAFTLVEVLTVIVIIGILASITAFVYASALSRSRDSQRLNDLKSIQNSLEQFYLENRHYPIYQSEAPVVYHAKFQLEEGFDCQQPNKDYLAPKLMTLVPEDPSKKVAGNSCAGTMFGHYLYFGTPIDSSRTGFVLMARMERSNNVNWESSVGTDLEDQGYDDFYNSVSPCEQQDFNTSPEFCSHNYFLKNSRNN